MNYRHQFHAGNFADVVKQVILGMLVGHLQQKEKGFLYLDTHAGRGRYDLELSARGLTRPRRAEWLDGIGRLAQAGHPPAAVAEYLARVADHNGGAAIGDWKTYPGSPLLAAEWARPQDRMVFCEQQPEEAAALRALFTGQRKLLVEETDGYAALRAFLPPPERRALVLIDPPYEAEDEWARVLRGLDESLRRFRTGVYAVWYPLSRRADRGPALQEWERLAPVPSLVAELAVAGEDSSLAVRGCGLLILNPPWQFAEAAREALDWLAGQLAQGPGAKAEVRELVERE